MSDDCKAEFCPMWDGDTCPCETFGLDPENLPRKGTFTRTVHGDPGGIVEIHEQYEMTDEHLRSCIEPDQR